jgi:Protein of unknown function (DUF3455)
MKRRLVAGLAAIVAATATILTASGAAAATPDVATAGAPGGPTPNAQLPAAIQVDETQNKVVASFVGIGKQVYDCNAAGTAFTFREPVAGLLSRGVQAAIHGKGPFWASFDGSHVDGSGAVSPPASSAYTDLTKNVPWLRLVGTPTPNTTGVFSNVAFIQRLDTRGGVAPAGPCTAPKTVAVDYTANYVFWAKK